MTNIEFTSGLGAGFLSAIIFNPIDKAIYLSTTKDLKITNSNLWKGLYKGSSLSILTRIITSGLYFSYIDYYSSFLNSNFQVASITALSCLITNPLQIVKFKSWYSDSSITDTYFHIKNKYGYRGFMIGGSSLFMRDLVFNYIYLSLKKNDEHLNNIGGICLALVAVAPLNLIKNKKYGNNESLKTIIKNFKFSQLGISYSVIRMGLGFYTSQYLYDSIKSTLSS